MSESACCDKERHAHLLYIWRAGLWGLETGTLQLLRGSQAANGGGAGLWGLETGTLQLLRGSQAANGGGAGPVEAWHMMLPVLDC